MFSISVCEMATAAMLCPYAEVQPCLSVQGDTQMTWHFLSSLISIVYNAIAECSSNQYPTHAKQVLTMANIASQSIAKGRR